MRLFFIKVLYSICSLITTFLLRIKGVSCDGIVYTSGLPHVFKGKDSSINVGRNIRMLNLSWMNSVGLNHRCIITTEKKAVLNISNNVGMSGATIWCFKHIDIDNNVRIGANTLITDGDAHLDDPRAGKPKPVHICENVWLGMNVIVLKGVTIGRNSLVGAGSVVTKNIPENVVAAGNPCKVIKQLDEEIIKKLEA